ncbi:MAG: hypothetical protein K0B87_05320 [Candidatus Syntrophosphaera sp.]|nr:hypothetical protein [Candidatus Syntrophosphaera sp.]
MKKSRLHACELKRHRQIAPPLCAVCPRILKCRSFRIWHRLNRSEYLDFVIDICRKFPDKYIMEVSFMAEKQTFVQIVDMATGKIDRIVNLDDINAMTPEEKLELSRNKNLFIVTHRLEPIVRVELKRTMISEPVQFAPKEAPASQPIEELTKEPIPTGTAKSRKKK